jgi:hypothetical protein
MERNRFNFSDYEIIAQIENLDYHALGGHDVRLFCTILFH